MRPRLRAGSGGWKRRYRYSPSATDPRGRLHRVRHSEWRQLSIGSSSKTSLNVSTTACSPIPFPLRQNQDLTPDSLPIAGVPIPAIGAAFWNEAGRDCALPATLSGMGRGGLCENLRSINELCVRVVGLAPPTPGRRPVSLRTLAPLWDTSDSRRLRRCEAHRLRVPLRLRRKRPARHPSQAGARLRRPGVGAARTHRVRRHDNPHTRTGLPSGGPQHRRATARPAGARKAN